MCDPPHTPHPNTNGKHLATRAKNRSRTATWATAHATCAQWPHMVLDTSLNILRGEITAATTPKRDQYEPSRRASTHRKRGRSATPPPSRDSATESPLAEHKRRKISGGKQVFQPGASRCHSACTICLGRFPHHVAKCTSATLWSGGPAYCTKNGTSQLVNPKGLVLCTDWQKPSGCNSTGHDSKHECSGCGKSDHGAQRCPQAEKA